MSNIFCATPVCVRMPVPTIETLLDRSSPDLIWSAAQTCGALLDQDVRASQAPPWAREAEARAAYPWECLHDHVHDDVLLGDRPKNTVG